MNEVAELWERLDVFFESLLFSLPQGGGARHPIRGRDLKENLISLFANKLACCS